MNKICTRKVSISSSLAKQHKVGKLDISLTTMITEYGYVAVAVGAFLEGETALLFGAFAAHRNYLQLPWVVLSGVIGSVIADQLYFYLGRIKGKGYLQKKAYWQQKSIKVFTMLDKYPIAFILGFRFFYGFRTLTPIIIGISDINYKKFFIFNVLGAIIWSLFFCTLGYLFGHAMTVLLDEIKGDEDYILTFIIALGVIASLLHFYYNRKR